MQEISLHWLNSLRKQLKVCIQMPVYDLQLSELIHTNHWEKTHSFIQQIFMLWILYARFCIKVHSDKQEQHYLCSPVTSKIKICVYIYIYMYMVFWIYIPEYMCMCLCFFCILNIYISFVFEYIYSRIWHKRNSLQILILLLQKISVSPSCIKTNHCFYKGSKNNFYSLISFSYTLDKYSRSMLRDIR